MPSITLPETYTHWRDTAKQLLDPLMRIAPAGGSEIPLEGPPSDHDANADRLEAFARPCLLAAFWLQADHTGGAAAEERDAIAAWFRGALLGGTDPEDPSYWGPNTNYHQNGVEIGLLVIALKVASADLWEPLSPSGRARIVRWIASNRGTGHHWNNHLFFGVLCLEFLREVDAGRPSDDACIERWFAEMESMYRRDGWFMDGMNQAYDHYNAYAFHFYGLVWAHQYGDRNPPRAQRWKAWAQEFLGGYQHVFAASGEHPAFGRSISYRFNACAPFPLAVLAGCSPVSAGRAHGICTRNLGFFLSKPVFQNQGALSLGWHDEFKGLAEKYSCAGSPYWAAKAFCALLLPPDHPFWTEPEEPAAGEDTVVILDAPGLTIRAFSGETEILNAGTEICPPNMERFGAWKWGKLSYRSGVGFTLGTEPGRYSPDSGLTAEDPRTGIVYGRHFTTPLAQTDAHLACAYALGGKAGQANVFVESYLWWKRGWLLQVHYIDAFQDMILRLGGFSLAARKAADLTGAADARRVEVTRHDGRKSLLQNLTGFESAAFDERLDNTVPRVHIEAPYHKTPLLQARIGTRPGVLAALVWTGSDPGEGKLWTLPEARAGHWCLEHRSLGTWTVDHEILPELESASDGSSV